MSCVRLSAPTPDWRFGATLVRFLERMTSSRWLVFFFCFSDMQLRVIRRSGVTPVHTRENMTFSLWFYNLSEKPDSGRVIIVGRECALRHTLHCADVVVRGVPV